MFIEDEIKHYSSSVRSAMFIENEIKNYYSSVGAIC